MKLVYRTRGNTTPQGKPKVYFTGHPADLPIYSESIFADILKTQNCAIFYDEEPDTPCDQDEFFQELERMQLMVIPVTSRFLYQPNRAREAAFPFAIERRIPVLPLMQEPGLESVFNETCGSLQLLNKYDPDPTALPYSEKLEKFLSSVLAGDELAEKVRKAFDAYVFLSYRKKDRKYAQELMRLIHKNPFCRDIAIWYDEFLVPGENFNTAIADAMKKCQLFALAVTPNIIEEGNYVMQIEYPEARKLGKPIFPVELVPTNREALWDSFEDIPPCTNANDESAFSSALLEAVKHLTIQENNNSSEHDFCIGLAYLNGIDVEVDRKRALSIIIDVAEAGLPEAMEKLVSMYQNGDGVARDYRVAVRWQERLVIYWQERYEASGALNDGLYYGINLSKLGSGQKELGDLAAAKRSYQQMRDVYQQLLDTQPNTAALLNFPGYLALSYERLGDLSKDEGNSAEATEYYQQSLELRRQFSEKTGTEWKYIAISYDKLGNLSRDEGKPAEAKAYYLKSLKLREKLCEETGTVEARRDLSICYEQLGGVSEDAGNLSEAKAYYQQSMKLMEQLYRETRTMQAQYDLAFSLFLVGSVSDFEEKKNMWELACGAWADLCEQYPNMPEFVQQLEGIRELLDELS